MNIVGYCRLSRDDGDDCESTSISNQQKIITEFAKNNDMKISKFYIDDGISGYTEDRPSFNRLKIDLNNDMVDVIIAKDLSRIGRHSAKVQLFLENIIEADKRVITVGDNYDSDNTQSHDMVGIQTWVNEKYVRDVSTKVRKAINTMQQEGSYISSVPYGYYINPIHKNKYHIDELCAMYVKEMFDMYLNGYGISAIAKEFTQRNVPTSTMIKNQRLEQRGLSYKGNISTKWAPNTIVGMLRNPFYIGTLVLGKTKRRSINGKKVNQSDDKQYTFENAHEAIIDEQTFNLVQETMAERMANKYRGKRIKTRPNIFAGVLYCSDCGARMTSSSNNWNTRYICQTYHTFGTAFCSSHSITESELKESLIYFLEHCRDNLSSAIKDLDNIIKESYDKPNEENIIDVLNDDLKRTELETKALLEQKMREIMKNPLMADTIDEMYDKMLNEKYAQIKSIKQQINDKMQGALDDIKIAKDLNSAMDIINNIIETKEITKRQITTIVHKIVVHKDNGIDIYLKGNIHEICTNYVDIKSTKYGKMVLDTMEYIRGKKDNIYIKWAFEYVKSKGHRVGLLKFTDIFKMLIDAGYLKLNEGYLQGYKLVVPYKKMYDDFFNSPDIQCAPWCTANNVTLDNILSICEWIQGMQYNKKNIF